LEKEFFMMRKAAIGFVLMLAGCGAQPNYILVMTTFALTGTQSTLAVGTQTVIQGFRNKEECQLLATNGTTHSAKLTI
jgi:hypothetical protein